MFYSVVDERNREVNPAHQLQEENLQHEASSKRHRLVNHCNSYSVEMKHLL